MGWALASWWGVRSAKSVVVIGAGGQSIWNSSPQRVPFPLPMLAQRYASDYLEGADRKEPL